MDKSSNCKHNKSSQLWANTQPKGGSFGILHLTKMLQLLLKHISGGLSQRCDNFPSFSIAIIWIIDFFLSTCGKCAFPSILQDTKDDYCCKPLVSKVCMLRISGISSPPTCSLDSQNLPSTRFRVTISSSTYPTSYDHHLHPRSCYSLWKVHGNLVENCIRCFLNKWRMQQWHMWFKNYTYTHNV